MVSMGTVYFTAASLDGFIVDDKGSLDWLTSRAIDVNGPFGYKAFETGVGALVMGAETYEWLLANQPGEWMYTSHVGAHPPSGHHRRRASGAGLQWCGDRPASAGWWQPPATRTSGWSGAETSPPSSSPPAWSTR